MIGAYSPTWFRMDVLENWQSPHSKEKKKKQSTKQILKSRKHILNQQPIDQHMEKSCDQYVTEA